MRVEEGVSYDSLTVTVQGSGGGPVAFERVFERVIDAPRFPFQLTVAPRDGDVSRIFRVRASATNSGGTITGEVRGGYVEGRTTFFELTLSAACDNVVCGINEMCVDGACRPVARPDAGVPDAGLMDSAIDTGEPDSDPVDSGADSLDAGRLDTGSRDADADSCILPACSAPDADSATSNPVYARVSFAEDSAGCDPHLVLVEDDVVAGLAATGGGTRVLDDREVYSCITAEFCQALAGKMITIRARYAMTACMDSCTNCANPDLLVYTRNGACGEYLFLGEQTLIPGVEFTAVSFNVGVGADRIILCRDDTSPDGANIEIDSVSIAFP